MEMSRYSSLTPDEQMAYNVWRLHENDQMLREERAHYEGANQQAWKSAERMMDKNMPLELISEVTGLSIEDLQNHKDKRP